MLEEQLLKTLLKIFKTLFLINICVNTKNTIKETYEEFFNIETLVKTEIIKYYIDNLYVSSSCDVPISGGPVDNPLTHGNL